MWHISTVAEKKLKKGKLQQEFYKITSYWTKIRNELEETGSLTISCEELAF